ncbi:MAG: phosphoenolpyruvate--protein phosphotransferase [Chloroflexi bacterium]|nr:phosphoenolpyruvate--protein phosphotransferase [Chloroflexota bacterium]
MVGLVVVSHSAQLAAGVAELMRGMAGPDVRIATAGGVDLPDLAPLPAGAPKTSSAAVSPDAARPLGTDVNLIRRAIEQVYSDDGVVVLTDLGSAILSTEMAVEMFAPERRARIMLAPAALVEGGLAAAVQARLGSDLNAVVHEARTALDAKLAHLGAQLSPAAPDSPTNHPTLRLTRAITNRLGLHARPAARFVQIAAQFQSKIQLCNLTTLRGPVNAKSINAVTTLGVLRGHEIEITAAGQDAQAALDALQKLADENFGDVETVVEPAATPQPMEQTASSQNELVGRAASPGYAIGAARVYRPTLPPLPENKIDDAAREWARLQAAIQQAQTQLRATRSALQGRGGRQEADIFDAQVLMLQDDALQEPARRAIFEQRQNAAHAIYDAAEQVAADYDALGDEYLRARGADVRAVARQVLLSLLGISHTLSTEPGILVASDLTPAETASLDPQTINGLCTAFGGPTGHSAILAKSLGIPAAVGLGERILQVNDGDTLVVDGTTGRVWVNPDATLQQEYHVRIENARRAAEAARRTRHAPAMTRDGHPVEIAANIGSRQDARHAVEMGAEAVGLFRTEFLFLDRRDAPSEDEQYETYRAAANALLGRPLLLRTLDIGGDKPLPYVNLPPEANPFLGVRGLRLCLARPELFKTQLRAILRVGAEFSNLRVMFPMVSTLQEFHDALALLDAARAELAARDLAAAARIETGIMVEVPSAALEAAHFARIVDFFSIGTNDLTQYTLAAERGNPNIAALTEAFQPAVLQLIAQVVTAAHAHKKWVGVCGEMGGDPQAIPLLVGLGVDELSMSPPLIPQAKQIVRELNFADAQAQAQRALE